LSEPHYWLVMPAAGRGQRLGADLPKQYLSIAGRSLLEWALRPFVADPACRGLVVALGPGDPYWPAVRARLGRAVIEAPGGKERGDSVRQALETLRTRGAADADWVLVHDAARPCLSATLIHRLVEAVLPDAVGGILALPVADTVKVSDEARRIAGTVDRHGLWLAQTPQMFRFGLLREALESADPATVTDEASAVQALGHRPLLVEGDVTNLKVTWSGDAALAACILAAAGAPP